MLIDEYTLPELLDLALRVPEVGAVNFNILHTVLKTIISELGLEGVKPWCNIENPVVARAALTNLKLNSPQPFKKSRSEDHIAIKKKGAKHAKTSGEVTPAEGKDEDVEDYEESDRQDDPEDNEHSNKGTEEDDEMSDEERDENRQETGSRDDDEELDKNMKGAQKSPSKKEKVHLEGDEDTTEGKEEVQKARSRKEKTDLEDDEESDKDIEEDQKVQSRKEKAHLEGDEELDEDTEVQKIHSPQKKTHSRKKQADSEDEESDEEMEEVHKTHSPKKKTYSRKEKSDSEDDEESDEDMKEVQKPHSKKKEVPYKDIRSRIPQEETTVMASDMWRTTNTTWRMQATEEGLEKLSFVVDRMADKLNVTTATALETMNEMESVLRPKVLAVSNELDLIHEKKADKTDFDALKELTLELDANKVDKDMLMDLIEEKVGGGAASAETIKDYEERIRRLEERLLNVCEHLGFEEGAVHEEARSIEDRFSELWAQIEAMKGRLKMTAGEEEPIDAKKIEEQDRLMKFLKDQLETLRHKVDIVESENKAQISQIDGLQNSCSDLQCYKADKAQIETELDGKADKRDLALKVDRSEFVATVEDLGDSIDELVDKFKKNETEWHSAVNSINDQLKLKLSTSDYETLQIPIHNRIKALMYGFKKLKEIINSTLYPDAAGVTKCISCGRPAELAGTKCKPCGDMDQSARELAGSRTTKTLSLSDLKRPGDDHPSDSQGQSTVSLPDSTIIPPKTVPKKKSFMDEDINPGGTDLYNKKRQEEMEKQTVTEEPGPSSKDSTAKPESSAEISSLVKGIGLPRRKSKKETDHEFEVLMATARSTRFCGGTHTRTAAQQRGVTFTEFELPEPEKDHMVLIGYDANWYSGVFPAEKVGELPPDVDPDSVNMEDILDSCYDPYPPLPPKKYNETPRYCGGQHTVTDALQRGLTFAPYKMYPSPVRGQIKIEGSDGALYEGLEDTPGGSRETQVAKGKMKVEKEPSTPQPSIVNLPISQKGEKKPSLKRKGLTVVDIPTTLVTKMDSILPASKKGKSSKKGK